jgi:hypothetical protein
VTKLSDGTEVQTVFSVLIAECDWVQVAVLFDTPLVVLGGNRLKRAEYRSIF